MPHRHSHVVTLIAPEAEHGLAPASVETIRAVLNEAGHAVAAPCWLKRDVACDVAFTPAAPIEGRFLARDLARRLAPAPIDVGVQAASHRRKRLLIADMDSTIIEQECLDELADFAGLKERIAAITERAMAGELAFAPALRERVALLKGLPEHTLQTVIDERLTLTAGARALVATMKANGAVTCLVSGGFTFFTRRIAEAAGFDLHRGNRLEIEDGRLTGTVAEPILGREAKLATLRELMAAHDLAPEDTLAVGDGANDLAMIEAAGLGVAFRPHPILGEAADVRIDHGDLTALLYLQGYEEGEIAPAA